jgi:hypothetical protein
MRKFFLLLLFFFAVRVSAQTVNGFDGTNLYWNDGSGKIRVTPLVFPPPTQGFSAVLAAGAKCNGVNDDTGAIQQLYSSIASTTAPEITYPQNQRCVVSSTIILRNVQSGRVEGGSILWKGAANTPVFEYENCRDMLTEQMYITTASSSTYPMGTVFDIQEDSTAGFGISSGNIFLAITIDGVSSGGLNIGFELVQGSAGNVNNDQMQFYGNEVRNYTHSAFKIDHNQSNDHTFIGNKCYGNSNGLECVDAFAAQDFQWFGGFTGGNTNADFVLGVNAAAPFLISGVNSEGSNRLVIAGGGGLQTPLPLTIDTVRFATNNLNADGHIILYGSPGPLRVEGGSYGQGYANCGDFYWNGGGSIAFGTVSAVTFYGSGSNGQGCASDNPVNVGIKSSEVTVESLVFANSSGQAVGPAY